MEQYIMGKVKLILTLLVLLLLPLISHGQNNEVSIQEPQKMSWIDKDGVKLGYKLDHFSPTKVDSIKNKPIDVSEKETSQDINSLKVLMTSIVITFLIYVVWAAILFIVLMLVSLLVLISVKWIHSIQNKR